MNWHQFANVKEPNFILCFILIVFSSTTLLSVYQMVEAISDGMHVVSGTGEGTLSCVDGTIYKHARISFMTGTDNSNAQRFGKLQFNYPPLRAGDSGTLNGVFNQLGSKADGDEFKLRTEFKSNICGRSNLLYLGDIQGKCGEDATTNLDGGYYLKGSFKSTVSCNESQSSQLGEVPQPSQPLQPLQPLQPSQPLQTSQPIQPLMPSHPTPFIEVPRSSQPAAPISEPSGDIDSIEKIRDTLQRITEKYRERNYGEAAALAVATYVLNFDSINDHLQNVDGPLSRAIDNNLRLDLRQSIDNKAPLEVIQHLVGTLNDRLDIAEQLLLGT